MTYPDSPSNPETGHAEFFSADWWECCVGTVGSDDGVEVDHTSALVLGHPAE
jgi:hypothetical protein